MTFQIRRVTLYESEGSILYILTILVKVPLSEIQLRTYLQAEKREEEGEISLNYNIDSSE